VVARIVHAVVFSAAAPPCIPSDLPPVDLVVAADAGLHAAMRLGWTVDVVVGDLDSVDADALAAARAAGAHVEEHPRDKDATDLELAIDAACARGATRVTVLDGRAGRLDHLLASMLLLAHPRYAAVEMHAVVDGARITAIPSGAKRELVGTLGEYVTLLPIGGPAVGVRTSGLRFALHGETLEVGSTRGVSNEMIAARACAAIESGALLVVQPGPEVAR
jgi:thiamine pyrophosphokinase